MTEFTAACIQLRTGNVVAENIAFTSGLIREAAAKGADFIITPETTGLMELGAERLFANTAYQDDDLAVKAFSELAAELGIWLTIGSLAIKLSDSKVANRCFVFGPDGSLVTTYDKLHMFDVDLPNGEIFRESTNYQAGSRAVTVDMPWGRFGLTICYDVRFPQLYRALAHGGAGYLTVPSAFTKNTGKDHWHLLLQTRAVENGCFVFAPAQGGTHENGRETYGHSLIISPWGEILAEAGIEPEVILAKIDPAQIVEARGRIAALKHDRPFELVNVEGPQHLANRQAS